MIEVIVADRTLDLYDDTNFWITFQVFSVFELEERIASYTRELEIPASDNNLAAFGGLTSVYSYGYEANQLFKCSVRFNGLEIIKNGEIFITTTEDNTLKCEIRYSNFSFFRRLGDQTLKDLDLTDLNFLWSMSSLVTLATQTEDLTFSQVDTFDQDSVISALNNVTDPRNPLLDNINFHGFFAFAKMLIRRIAEQNGYNFDDSLISGDAYNKLLLWCPVFQFSNPVLGGSQSYVTLASEQFSDFSVPLRLDYTITSDPNGWWVDVPNGWVIPPGGDGLYIFSINFGGSFDVPSGPAVIEDSYFKVIKDSGGTLTDVYTYIPDFAGPISGTETNVLTMAAGDVLYVEIFGGAASGNKTERITISSSDFTLQQEGALPGDNIVVSEHVPDISQADFLRWVAQLDNFLIITDDINQEVRLVSFDEVTKTLDWSKYLDNTKPIETSKTLRPEYFQKSTIKYADDPGLRRTDFNHVETFSDKTLDATGVIIDNGLTPCDDYPDPPQPFGANIPSYSVNVEKQEGFNVPLGSLNTFNFTDPGTGNPIDVDINIGDFIGTAGQFYFRVVSITGPGAGVFIDPFPSAQTNVTGYIWRVSQIKDGPFKIAIQTDTQGGTGFKIYDNNTWISDPNTTNIQYYLLDHNVLKWSNLVDENYKGVFDVLQTPFFVRAWFVLPITEVNRFTFDTFIYLQQFNAYFYVNVIEQYRPDGLCRMDLIRIR